jgi:hypothetical protein
MEKARPTELVKPIDSNDSVDEFKALVHIHRTLKNPTAALKEARKLKPIAEIPSLPLPASIQVDFSLRHGKALLRNQSRTVPLSHQDLKKQSDAIFYRLLHKAIMSSQHSQAPSPFRNNSNVVNAPQTPVQEMTVNPQVLEASAHLKRILDTRAKKAETLKIQAENDQATDAASFAFINALMQSPSPVQQQAPTARSLFGQPAVAPSVFGQQQPAVAPSVFGQQQQAVAPSVFGQQAVAPSGFGQQQLPNMPVAPSGLPTGPGPMNLG